MALVRIKNFSLVDKREPTYLTASVAAAGTTLTVQDNNQFITDNEWYLLGAIGSETSEIVQNNASTTLGTSITVDAITFAHPINTPLYRLDYNQYRLAHSTTTSTNDIDAANVSTAGIQFDDTYTRYQDSTYTTGYFFVRFYNSQTTIFSDYSAAIPVGGHTQLSLWETARRVYKFLGFQLNDDMDETVVKFSEVRRALNDKQREIVHERLWTFAEGERSFSTVANQFRYVPDPLRIGIMNTVTHDSKPLKYMDRQLWEMTHIDSDSTSSYATHFSIWNNEIHLFPKPSSAASSTTMNDTGGISATDTSVTITSNSGFRATGGFYRFIIESEVIYATATTTTTFTGLLRGRENTTAATHADGLTITERDLVYTFQVEPQDMVDIIDETIVPEPDVLAKGAAADIARGALRDNALADRLEKGFKENMVPLRNKYSKKVKTTFSAVKDIGDTVDSRNLLNQNDYPSSLS
ncbi:MAG: hypothetical protein AAB922_06095 [Patescibacteria group bacterium]